MVTHPRFERGTPWLKVRCSASWANESYKLAGVKGFEPLNDGVRVRCLTAWRYPYIYKGINLSKKNGSPSRTRTYDRSVNSRLLYRLSYRGMKVERKTRFELATPALARRCSTTELFPHTWCPRTESNCRHKDFQSFALPTELPRQIIFFEANYFFRDKKMATPIRFELTIFAVTGRHVNRYTTGPQYRCFRYSIIISWFYFLRKR